MTTFSKPTPEQVDKTIHKLLKVATQQYFFERLNNPHWLEPLHERGIFKSVPHPLYSDDKTMVRFPHWPAANYLMRMAKEAPDVVTKIIDEIPETENANVQYEIANIALNLPVKHAAQIGKKVEKWVRNISRFSRADVLFELTKYLVNGGQTESGFKLAEAFLKLESGDDDMNATGVWYYEQALKSVAPTLLAIDPKRTLNLLCSLLRHAINAGRGDNRKPPNDYLYIMRPEVDGSARYPSLENSLIDAIRDNAEAAIHTGILELRSIAELLESFKWWIFVRIELYLLAKYPNRAFELASARATDSVLFGEHQCRTEYSLLLTACFNDLRADQKKVVIDRIMAGPDLEQYKRNFKQNRGENPPEEYLVNFKRHWIRDRLLAMGKILPQDLVPVREKLVQELGSPEPIPETWMGPTSPKSIEELRVMGIEKIVQYLRDWIPSHDMRSPSHDGLGRVLLEIVKESPSEFAGRADLFIGLEPTYIGNFILGLVEAAKSGNIHFSEVLALCKWTIQQDHSAPKNIDSEDDDEVNVWRYACQSIARLIDSALQNKSNPLSFELRDQIWEMLEALSNHSDPDDSYIPDQKGTMDSTTHSLNTVRGVAMHAAIQYALWVSQNLERKGVSKDKINFEMMPEVRRVLDFHLDATNDPSPAIRSVYGQWIPWLILLDREWAAKAVDLIFPIDECLKSLWHAAWNTYIRFCNAYDEVIPLLKAKYFLAIERIDWPVQERDHGNENLGAHLLTYYWRGKIGLSEDGLVSSFFRKATAHDRGKAMQFVGRSLLNDQRQEVPAAIKERLQGLWKSRLDAALQSKDRTKYDEEIGSFGMWFSSGIFAKEWSISQLLEALSLVKKVHYTAPIITELSLYVRDFPLEVAKCTKLLLLGADDNLHYLLHKDEVKSLLQSLLVSENDDAAKEARQLIHKFGERGFFEFRSLLNS